MLEVSEALWETSVPPGTVDTRTVWRRPWRMSGRTAVHQLRDGINSASFGGFVHSYLYMLNVNNNSPCLGVTVARHRVRCIAHAYLIQSSLRCRFHGLRLRKGSSREVRLLAQGHMVSRAGI